MLTLWKPNYARHGVDRFFDNFFDAPAFQGFNTVAFRPNVNILETESNLVLTVELPGLSKEDINVSVEKGVLTISGERKFERDEDKDNYRLVEHNYGSFIRRFRLGDQIDVDKIEATVDKGILTVTLNKIPEIKPRTIEIK